MVTMNKQEQKEAHKVLHKKIYDCSCRPYLSPWEYCEDCKNAVLEFMRKYGAGVLTRDAEIEELAKEYSKCLRVNLAIIKRLDEKIKRVEELKAEIKRRDDNDSSWLDQDIDISSLLEI